MDHFAPEIPRRATSARLPDAPLPALPQPTRTQLLLSAIFIAAALLLLAAVVVRITDQVGLRHWWIAPALLAGIAAADFASGLVHWAADTWGRADLPVIGRRILVPFRVHHLNPDDLLRRSGLDTNGDAAGLTVPVLVGLLFIPLDTASRGVVAVFGVGLCAAGAMTNQIHQWAHTPSPPAIARAFQQLGVLLPSRAHAAHHESPYDAHYCITTGWCNGSLEALAFFRRLETAITRLTGAVPREDERSNDVRHRRIDPAVAQDV